MQKHADRVDKRPPISAGPGHAMPGLADPYWPKMDPLAAMQAWQGYQPVLDPRLGELEAQARDQGYGGWDPRTSSAFSPLLQQPPAAPVAHKTSMGFDPAQFAGKVAGQGQGPQQDMKGGFISLASIRNYSSDKPANGQLGEKQQ